MKWVKYTSFTKAGTEDLICSMSSFFTVRKCQSFSSPCWEVSLLCLLQLCMSACQHLSQDKLCACNCIQPCHMRCLRLLTLLHKCKSNITPNQISEQATKQELMFLLLRIVYLHDFYGCYRVTFFFRAFGRFMVMWFIWPCGTLMMPGSLACHPYSWTTVLGERLRWRKRDCHTSTKSL